ncbi:hypothetical protein VTN49DRAFT_4558 [Thermomyces lanuginosus]|uniref:uncharacterized protein n=1 Tax=Thermomyces lanuginosus TaxID=5541 RepID=UPI003743B8A6
MSQGFPFSEHVRNPMEEEEDNYPWHPFPHAMQSITAYQELPMMTEGMVGSPPALPLPLDVLDLAYTSSSNSSDVTGRASFMDLQMSANVARPEKYGMMPSSPFATVSRNMGSEIPEIHNHEAHQTTSSDHQDCPDQQQQQQPTRKSSPRSESPEINNNNNDPSSLAGFGIRNADGTWRCAHPSCTSKTRFTRACDLRKHFNRHNKYLFCRYDGCPQSVEAGFSSKKDRARHEAKHNPQIACEWAGCNRVFSRVDNMKDHVRRIHKKGPSK